MLFKSFNQRIFLNNKDAHDVYMTKILLLAVAGALGAVARYGLAGLVQKLAGPVFPWGTVIVNLLGCLVVGLLWAMFEDKISVSAQTRIIVLVGFMGAFTTFSTFIAETGELLRTAQWAYAAGNIILQNAVGLLAFFAGNTIGKWV
jgi:fluoride exporter